MVLYYIKRCNALLRDVCIRISIILEVSSEEKTEWSIQIREKR